MRIPLLRRTFSPSLYKGTCEGKDIEKYSTRPERSRTLLGLEMKEQLPFALYS